MRSKSAPYRSRRARKGFLLLPKTLGDETRWLEWAMWEDIRYLGAFRRSWVAWRWRSEEEYDALRKWRWYFRASDLSNGKVTGGELFS